MNYTAVYLSFACFFSIYSAPEKLYIIAARLVKKHIDKLSDHDCIRLHDLRDDIQHIIRQPHINLNIQPYNKNMHITAKTTLENVDSFVFKDNLQQQIVLRHNSCDDNEYIFSGVYIYGQNDNPHPPEIFHGKGGLATSPQKMLLLKSPNTNKTVTAFAVSSNKKSFIIGYQDGDIDYYHKLNYQKRYHHKESIIGVGFSPDHMIISWNKHHIISITDPVLRITYTIYNSSVNTQQPSVDTTYGYYISVTTKPVVCQPDESLLTYNNNSINETIFLHYLYTMRKTPVLKEHLTKSLHNITGGLLATEIKDALIDEHQWDTNSNAPVLEKLKKTVQNFLNS